MNWLRFPERGAGSPLPEWPLERLLDAAAAAGFWGIGLDRSTVGAYVAGGGRVEELGELVRARGLVCTDVGVLPLGTADVAAAASELTRLASATGAGVCLASHFEPVSSEQSVRQLAEAAAILGEADVRIALEFVAYGSLRTLGAAIELCEAVGWERCGLLVDTWHVFRGEEPLSLLRSLRGDRIAIVHLNDGAPERGPDPVFEGRFERLPVGAGSFPLGDFAAALAATGYGGVLSTEVLSAELRARPPEDAARDLMAALRSGWPGLR